MISYLSGSLLTHTSSGAIILVSGVGYECFGSWLTRITIGEMVECYTYHYLENQSLPRLIATPDLASRDMLIELLSVSGVGPKMAGRILDGLGRERLVAAITGSDLDTLSTVKGLGKKTAQKIILELGKKLVLETGAKSSYFEALGSLGFTHREIDNALSGIKTEGLDENQVIAMLLRKLGGKR